MTLLGLVYTPYGANEMNGAERFMPPCLAHPMGTDSFGRDVFSRVMIGGRYTLAVALFTITVSSAAGISLGMAAGYAGGIWDELVVRLIDVLSSFPAVLLALTVVSRMGNGPDALSTALVLLFIPGYTRIARNEVLRCKHADFTLNALVMGASHRRILFVHLLPNMKPAFFSAVYVGLSNAIISESAMSYLGFGAQPPFPSWGRMLSESQGMLFNAPWCALAPGTVIVLTVLSIRPTCALSFSILRQIRRRTARRYPPAKD
jgi:peptide/nickel transport system permease protein